LLFAHSLLWEVNMRSSLKFGALSAAFIAAAVMAPTDKASAGVMSIAGKSTVEQSSAIDQVHWRRVCHRHHWRHARWACGSCGYAWYPRYRYSYYPWRYRYSSYYPYGYGYGSYGGYGYNAGAAVAGTALGLATAPLWLGNSYWW
jgi:hypothetical protein